MSGGVLNLHRVDLFSNHITKENENETVNTNQSIDYMR